MKLDWFQLESELQGMQNVYHRHFHAVSFETVQKQKSTMFY